MLIIAIIIVERISKRNYNMCENKKPKVNFKHPIPYNSGTLNNLCTRGKTRSLVINKEKKLTKELHLSSEQLQQLYLLLQ